MQSNHHMFSVHAGAKNVFKNKDLGIAIEHITTEALIDNRGIPKG